MSEKRSRTRNKVWPETEAVITYKTYRDLLGLPLNTFETFKGNVDNLGTQGIFIKSKFKLPIDTKLEILIDFNPGGTSDVSIKAEGFILRNGPEGFAARLTNIDSKALGDCIMKKMALCNVGAEFNYRCA